MRIEPFLLFFGVAFFPVTATLTALWLSARKRAATAEAIVHQLAVVPALTGERSVLDAQFGQALDAIALEVERISEGQRFATKILAERRDQVMPGSVPPRVNTPH